MVLPVCVVVHECRKVNANITQCHWCAYRKEMQQDRSVGSLVCIQEWNPAD